MSSRFLIYTASGAQNLGDECILAAEILLLWTQNKNAIITIASYDISATQQALGAIFSHINSENIPSNNLIASLRFINYFPSGFKRYPLRNILSFGKNIIEILLSDEVIIGGGGIIYDVEKEQSFAKLQIEWGVRIFFTKLFRKKLHFWNIGVDVSPENLRHIRGWFLGSKTTVTVRDSYSYELLKLENIPAKRGEDSVFSLPFMPCASQNTSPSKDTRKDKNTFIGIACRQGYLEKVSLKEIIEKILQFGFTPIFISHSLHSLDEESNDYGAYKSIANDFGITITQSIPESIDAYGIVSGIISMRLHASILAIQSGIPFFPISYSKKTEHILKDRGISTISCKSDTVVFMTELNIWLESISNPI